MIEQLQTIVNEQKLSHAYLMEGIQRGELKSLALTFASLILCHDDTCRARVSQHNYADFFWLETDEQTIKKEMIEEILHRMNQKPIEGEFKVYVIVDFDKVTVQGENSILKFLEEPPPNTIALLLTTRPNEILPTIHSRCQHLTVESEDAATIHETLVNGGVNESLAHTLTALSLGVDEAKEWLEEKDFQQVRASLIKWADTVLTDGMMGLIQIADLLHLVGEREQQLLMLDMLQLYLQDIVYIKIGRQHNLSFPDHAVKLDKIAGQQSLPACIKQIDAVLEGKRKLTQYVNPVLVFEQIAIHLMRGV